MIERCLAETVGIILAHRREMEILRAGGATVEVARRQALVDRERTEDDHAPTASGPRRLDP
jgi:hypothetical protein